MERHTYRVTIAYNGGSFAGFARQPGLPTVESHLIEALSELLPSPPRIAVGGRTDRGVHAVGQVISFFAHRLLDPDLICKAIDEAAPGELTALEARVVPRSFHAAFSARARRYVYFHEGAEAIDVGRLDRMLAALVGRRCFSAFARDIPREKKTVRTLHAAGARIDGDTIRIELYAESFLRRQVRTIVATVLREAKSEADDQVLVRLAEANDRKQTGPAAPAENLYLWRITY